MIVIPFTVVDDVSSSAISETSGESGIILSLKLLRSSEIVCLLSPLMISTIAFVALLAVNLFWLLGLSGPTGLVGSVSGFLLEQATARK